MSTTALHELVSPDTPEEEIVLIQRAYRRLLRSIKVDVSRADRLDIRKAFEVAVRAHRQQRRKSGEPYILHPIEVATICATELGLGPTAIVAALLHDVVEDTDVTLQEIRETFGPKIMALVDGLTKLDGSLSGDSPQAENFRKVLLTLLDDVRVVLIKMADRMHNMRTIASMPPNKQLKIAAETAYIYAPLAHRLGLYTFKTEFQDIILKVNQPNEYKEIAAKLDETKRERNRYIAEFIRPLRELIDALGVSYEIFGRPKSIYSIYQKIQTKEIAFEDIFDLSAIRVVLDVDLKAEKSMCWQVYSLVTDVYRPIPERLKDWITQPKSNGYESLHTTVLGPKGRYVEIQIRSRRMNEIAEKGFAAHWKYKGISKQPDRYESWLDSIRELIDGGSGNAAEFLADFKTNLFHEDVFVSTPKGDMINLPKGATALDFAFAVHSMVGYHAQAVRVNQKLVPMGYELQTGDRVEVITNRNQRPNEGWLKFVVTGKARAKIRSALKEERRRQGELGREDLERKLAHRKVAFDPAVEAILKRFRFGSRVDLFYALATGQLSTTDIFREFDIEQGRLSPKPAPTTPDAALASEAPSAPTSRSARAGQLPADQLLVNGEPAAQYDYALAACCNPVQGDPIFGYLSGTNQLKIHRVTCKNAEHLLSNYGYRVLEADWGIPVERNFVANLLIKGMDTGKGVIDQITHELSHEQDLNIRAMNIEGTGGYFECNISLVVANLDQLAVAMNALSSLEAVTSVVRA